MKIISNQNAFRFSHHFDVNYTSGRAAAYELLSTANTAVVLPPIIASL